MLFSSFLKGFQLPETVSDVRSTFELTGISFEKKTNLIA